MAYSSYGERFRHHRLNKMPLLATLALHIGGTYFILTHLTVVGHAIAVPLMVLFGLKIVSFALPPPYGAATRCLIAECVEMNARLIVRGLTLYERFITRLSG